MPLCLKCILTGITGPTFSTFAKDNDSVGLNLSELTSSVWIQLFIKMVPLNENNSQLCKRRRADNRLSDYTKTHPLSFIFLYLLKEKAMEPSSCSSRFLPRLKQAHP